MSSPVHALLVAHADAPGRAAAQLTRTLTALAEQRPRLSGLTVVIAGEDARLRSLAAQAGAGETIVVPAGTGFATAIERAVSHVPDGRHLWLLAQDTAPEPDALGALVGMLELAPSVAFVAPKLVDWSDPSRIVSLGVTMTGGGRSVELADGQFDQGQLDANEDVLGTDIRGVLIRAERRGDLLPDRALAGADEGLDLGVRARLAGHRVALAPAARVAVAEAGVAGLPKPQTALGQRRAAYSGRLAQLHRRLTYAAWPAMILHWLTLLPLALIRTAAHLVAKAPARVLPEWGATAVAAVRLPSITRSRRRLRGLRGNWGQLAPLRITRRELRARRLETEDAHVSDQRARGDLRFFTGGGAWVVLATLAVSVVANPGLLVWSSITGGGLLPLGDGLGSLWSDAAWGRRSIGLEEVGPADPFAAVVAAIGSLSPMSPSSALVALWIIALPLAALGGWFAATRVTDRSGLRMGAAVVWAFAPPFIAALVEPRPAAVVVHLALPWLFLAVTVMHRSWGAAGAASLVLVVIAAASPAVGALITVGAIIAMVVAFIVRAPRVVPRILWTIVPTLAAFIPLAWAQTRHGDVLALLADPGRPFAGTQAGTSLTERLQVIAGFPLSDPGGWVALARTFGIDLPAWAVVFAVVPLALLAVAAPLTRRSRVAIPLLIIAATALTAALLLGGIRVAFEDGEAIAVWTGSVLSLAWIAVLGCVLVTLDAVPWRQPARTTVAVIAVGLIALLAVPGVSASLRGDGMVAEGQDSTLPAFVNAEGRDDQTVGTLLLTPRADGGMATRVVWGSSETLGGQSTVVATRTALTEPDERLAAAVGDLITPTATVTDTELAELGIRFVLLSPEPSGGESEEARAIRLQASAALSARDVLAAVGETGKGELWRVVEETAPRPELTEAQHANARLVVGLQLAAVLIGLLLAVPTLASRRAERRRSRIVGLRREDTE